MTAQVTGKGERVPQTLGSSETQLTLKTLGIQPRV